ncbi:SRPBCC family protein [Streptomyces sp. NBS 14/10]|uniref:SRPBCC family protein n=1 Tax=Streptomyces sp. NBS 14/10 TaxID=1945643 RepID=UPI000B7F07DA|nr:SRPBCC family protein [Streptomyces sp. NBS 14/10]KAK1179014.1 SRPBCC family protein [Streptomyces sp. NBS 14/10]NUP44735.1 SRPBCC family protein [Streptomyces sp.]NUS81486.1 SRPBCC family protein [Streptomyces sp.]
MDEDYGVTGAHTEVELLVDLTVDELWAAITDLSRLGEWSPECTYAAWLDGWTAPEVGARYEARNRFPNGLVTQVLCVVNAADPPYAFGWDVYGGAPETHEPFATWRYNLRPAVRPDQTVVRQSFTHGPGDSGARAAVRADPANATAILQGRLDQLRRNMKTTIGAMVCDIGRVRALPE